MRSARQWLVKAEESFGKNRDIRGELDLLLAQAELQHAQEANRDRRPWYKSSAARHCLALVAAFIFIGCGYGAYRWSDDRTPDLVPPGLPAAVPRTTAAEKPALPAETTRQQDTRPAQLPPPASGGRENAPLTTPVPVSTYTVIKEKPAEPVSRPERKTPVSQEEMRNLIRAAGKSLRGE